MILQKNNQSGATMIEMIGVLAIVIMLTTSIISLVGNIIGLFNQNLVVGEIRDLQKNISGRYRFEGNYKALLKDKTTEEAAKMLCDEKLAPYRMCSGGELRHRLGGFVYVLPVEEGVDSDGNSITDYSKYAVVLDNLSNKACASAAQVNWFMQQKSDVYRMVINGGTAKEKVFELPQNITDGSTSATFPVKSDDVMDACQNDDDNSIEWIFF